MKTGSTFTKALLVVLLAAIFVAVISLWQTRRAQAIQDSEDFPSDFGFMELAAGQSARLNAVIGNPDETPGPDPVARRVRLTFDVYAEDPPGLIATTRYRFAHREEREVLLRPGQAVSFDFLASAATKIDASVLFIGNPNERDRSVHTPEPHLAATLEVRENARTIFLVPAVAKGFNPQPDPPGHRQ